MAVGACEELISSGRSGRPQSQGVKNRSSSISASGSRARAAEDMATEDTATEDTATEDSAPL